MPRSLGVVLGLILAYDNRGIVADELEGQFSIKWRANVSLYRLSAVAVCSYVEEVLEHDTLLIVRAFVLLFTK